MNDRVAKAQEELSSIQLEISMNGFSKDKLDREIEAHKNSAFFHKMVQLRKASREIPLLNIDSNQVTDQATITDHIIRYYSDLFSRKDDINNDNFNLIREVIPHVVSEADNHRLVSILFEDEIRQIVFAMDPNTAPGPYGFNGIFFSKLAGALYYRCDISCQGILHYQVHS